MLATQFTLVENGKSQSVSCQLDFGNQKWSMSQASGRWTDVVFSTEGTFEVRQNGVIWIWDGPSRRKSRNTLIIRSAPKSLSDTRHRSGIGRVYDPKDASLKDQMFSWKVTTPMAVASGSSVVLSPIRKRIMEVCDLKLPKGIKYNYVAGEPKNDGTGVTNCNIFVGLILSYIDPKDRRKMFKRIAGEPFAAPQFEWYLYAAKIDKERSPSVSTWVPFSAGKTPQPGDIYQLEVIKDKGKLKKGQTQHIGIIEDATGSIWKTIDGGQKAEQNKPSYACKRVERKFSADGTIEGEFGEMAKVKGWVNMDRLLAAVPEVFPVEYHPKTK